jgi:shikimate kinase
LIEAQAGLSVSEIFARHGEAVFRQIERRVVAELSQRRDIVAATGGGLGADPENLASLKTHALVICLWATAEAIWERTQHQTHRPLLQVADPLEQIRHLLTVREPVYRQADVLINTAHRQSREVVQQVIYHFCLARDASARP